MACFVDFTVDTVVACETTVPSIRSHSFLNCITSCDRQAYYALTSVGRGHYKMMVGVRLSVRPSVCLSRAST